MKFIFYLFFLFSSCGSHGCHSFPHAADMAVVSHHLTRPGQPHACISLFFFNVLDVVTMAAALAIALTWYVVACLMVQLPLTLVVAIVVASLKTSIYETRARVALRSQAKFIVKFINIL